MHLLEVSTGKQAEIFRCTIALKQFLILIKLYLTNIALLIFSHISQYFLKFILKILDIIRNTC